MIFKELHKSNTVKKFRKNGSPNIIYALSALAAWKFK
jgi:hypothetical protein